MGFLGQEGQSDLQISPDGKTLTWFTEGVPDPVEVYVQCDDEPLKLFGAGRGGATSMDWMHAGRLCRFDLRAGGQTILSLLVDTTGGFPVKSTLKRVAAAATKTPPPPGGGTELLPASSWFTQNTNVFGVDVPNFALAGGGALLLLAGLRKKR